MTNRFAVETYTTIDGWTNCWTEDDEPQLFATRAEAEKALADFLYDVRDMGYSADDYRIVEVSND